MSTISVTFVLGSFANSISSSHYRAHILRLVGGVVKEEEKIASKLMQHVQQAHERWISGIGQRSHTYLVQFTLDRTARLVDLLQTDSSVLMARGYSPSNVQQSFASRPDPLPDCQLRQIMRRDSRREKQQHPLAFATSGFQQIKAPYWPVALATDELGYRYLFDET